MRFGICIGNVGPAGKSVDQCLDLARRAERAGFDSVWVQDHPALTEGVGGAPLWLGAEALSADCQAFEPLVLLSSLAVVTERVTIGAAVLGIPYRHPAVTAKMLATADLLSGGRIAFGVGTGWTRQEFTALGLPPEHCDRRGEVTDEYVSAIKEMWLNTGPSNFSGEFVSFEDVGAFPKPAQRPHPPIIVAGSSRKAMVRASRLGTGYLATALSPDELVTRVGELQAVCRLDRRDPSELEVFLLARVQISETDRTDGRAPLTGSLAQIADDLRRYAIAGLDHLIIAPSPVSGVLIETLAAEIIPAFGSGHAR